MSGEIQGAGNRDRWQKQAVSKLYSGLDSKLSFIVDDYNVGDGGDDGDDNLPN